MKFLWQRTTTTLSAVFVALCWWGDPRELVSFAALIVVIGLTAVAWFFPSGGSSQKPDLDERKKSLMKLKSDDGITVIDALRLIDRLQQETVSELAIFVLESFQCGDPNAKDLLTETFDVGADGGISTDLTAHRCRCDVCGKLSPSARSEAGAEEWATDLGWQITNEGDLCPDHKLPEPPFSEDATR